MASSSAVASSSNAGSSSVADGVMNNPKKMLTLKTSDGENFEVEARVLLQSETIKGMIEDDVTGDNGIPLPNVTGKTFAKVMEYLNKHAEEGLTKEATEEWDKEYVKVDQATLFDVILAANYLNIKSLLDCTCQSVADSIKDMQPEEIRKIFNIENDFTPEEEAEIRKEHAWAFEE